MACIADDARGKTVLVVEDDPEVLEIALGMLAQLGYQVLVARDGASAMLIVNGPAQIDLLFSDVVMPGNMNGAELARQAKALRPGLPVLLTSGYTARALSQQHGFDQELPLLRKPYRLAEFDRAVREALTSTAAIAAPSEARSPRVLVVEDNVLVRLSTVNLLNECGFEVVADTGSGEAALQRLSELEGQVDVLFTDLGLPGISGEVLAAEAKRRQPDLRIVLATGYSRKHAAEAFDAIYLPKPFQCADLQGLRAQLSAGGS
jgi:CheY-like chemotaxis protein